MWYNGDIMTEMTWQQKATAIVGLVGQFDFALKLRDTGTWFVHTNAERKEGGCLSSGCDIEPTPQEAIGHYWDWITDHNYYMVLNAYGPNRRAVKWNGFMWKDVQEEKQC